MPRRLQVGVRSYEISQMDMAIRVEQHVVGLDVTVDDVLLVDVAKSAAQLRDPEANGLLGKGLSRDVEAQVSTRHKIDDNVQVLDVLEAVSQVAQEGVVEMFQHPSFSNHVPHAFTAYHCGCISACPAHARKITSHPHLCECTSERRSSRCPFVLRCGPCQRRPCRRLVAVGSDRGSLLHINACPPSAPCHD